MTAREKDIWHDITMLPVIWEMIEVALSEMEKEYQELLKIENRSNSLEEKAFQRLLTKCRYEQQLNSKASSKFQRWHHQPLLNSRQREMLYTLKNNSILLDNTIQKVTRLANRLVGVKQRQTHLSEQTFSITKEVV